MITNKGSKLIYISWNPNAVNNFNRMKEKEYINKIIINGNTLRLRRISENELVQILYKVNDDKYDQKKQRQMDNYIDEMVERFELEDEEEDENINYNSEEEQEEQEEQEEEDDDDEEEDE